jgi:hypothetical protein
MYHDTYFVRTMGMDGNFFVQIVHMYVTGIASEVGIYRWGRLGAEALFGKMRRRTWYRERKKLALVQLYYIQGYRFFNR